MELVNNFNPNHIFKKDQLCHERIKTIQNPLPDCLLIYINN
jgi:hypothetical protein